MTELTAVAEVIKVRLDAAVRAMDYLIRQAQEREHWDEVDRLKAKREGVALSLSYVEDEIRIAHQQQGSLS